MPSRRQLLRSVGVGTAAGLAGCMGSSLTRTTTETSPTTTATTQSSNQTETTTTTAEPESTGRFLLGGTELLDDFEDLGGWNADKGSMRATDETFRGESALRLTGPKASEFAWVSKSVDWDLSGKTLSLAVKVAKPVSENIIVSLRLLAPDTNNVLKMGELIRARKGQEWLRLDLATRDFEGNPDLSKVTAVEIGMEAASGPIDLVVDDLRAAPRPDTGKIALTFDDSLQSHYSEAFSVLQDYDMAGNVSVITGQVGSSGSLSVDQMNEMQQAGWEFASHGTTNQSLTKLSSQERWLAMTDSHDWLASKGLIDDRSPFVYPHGAFNADILDFASKYHSMGFRYLGPLGAASGKITDPMTISRGNAAYDQSLNKTMVNYAEIFKNLTVFTFHDIDGGGGLSMDTETFTDLIDYISRRDVEVVTFSDIDSSLLMG